MKNHQTCQRVLSQSALNKNVTISDNSQKADDVRQSRTQVGFVFLLLYQEENMKLTITHNSSHYEIIFFF